MKLFATILEPAFATALDAIRALPADACDGIELRAEQFDDVDFAALRASTPKPILYTLRGRAIDAATIARALAAGIDLVDVEWGTTLELAPYRERLVLSHHDYETMPDVESLLRDMRELGCAHTKLAVTPSTFADNQRLLRALAPGVSVIGMGERGLYSRILAPFVGSEITFVAASAVAAPGQLTLDRALDIYGSADARAALASHSQPPAVFAIAGNPAGHSRSPVIHNRLFREKQAHAAYTIASVASFEELETPFRDGTLRGLSITAPFKEDALRFAERAGAEIGENARECGAVNTLVHHGDRVVADNTDVDGFNTILARLCGRERKSVAIVGAGGTARAALVAVQRAGMHVSVFNRGVRDFPHDVQPLTALSRFDGEIIIDTLPGDVQTDLPFRPGMAYIEAAYGHSRARELAGIQHYDGLELLHAQALRQHELFMKALS